MVDKKIVSSGIATLDVANMTFDDFAEKMYIQTVPNLVLY